MVNTQNAFPETRFRHCHNVGLKMYSYAKNVLKWNENRCKDMYLLGLFHDIGYEFNGDSFKHDEEMSEALFRNGYRYYLEIKYHSCIQDIYDSDEMRLLYFGDMTVDGTGHWCSFEERMNDLEKRHGKNSKKYIESERIVNKLIEWGFDDKLSLSFYISHIF